MVLQITLGGPRPNTGADRLPRGSGHCPNNVNTPRGPDSMKRLWPAAILALPLAVACTSAKEKARADSVLALASQQKVLMTKLEAQKDSLSQVVADADGFIA